MKTLFRLLGSTKGIVTIEIEAFGFSMTQNVRIGSIQVFTDGVKFYTDNESEFFISEISSSIIEETHDDLFYTCVIRSVGAIITFTIEW